jgi:hypothetical protein
MGDIQVWIYTPRGRTRQPMTESFLRGCYQTRQGAVDSAQRALDELREQAIRDGLEATVRELDGARDLAQGESS